MFSWFRTMVQESEYILHETKNSALVRYLSVVFIILAYLGIVIWEYGVDQGFLITGLTWAFFVFCTPIADAGFILDFPVRVITGIRMIYSEMVVWCIAFTLTMEAWLFQPWAFHETIILNVFHHILSDPFPYWLLIVLSAMGTFMSVYFGDELIDVKQHHEREKHAKHKFKYKIVIYVFLFLLVFILYEYLLQELGITVL